MILNLKVSNKFIKYRKFKMDHIEQVTQLLKLGIFMASLDIQSAFSHAYILPHHKKFLCFEWPGKYYEFKCLPQGATCSPWLFVCITTPLMKYLRRRLITIVIYIDDTLLLVDSVEQMVKNLQLTMTTFKNVGFIINTEKFHLAPSKKLEFLGFVLDSEQFTISLAQYKIESLKKLITNAIWKLGKGLTIRDLSRIIGKIV